MYNFFTEWPVNQSTSATNASPAYCNVSDSNMQTDPFDTSNLTPQLHRYYSHVSPHYTSYSNLYNQDHYTDISISNQDIPQSVFNEQHTSKNTNMQQLSEKDVNEQLISNINAISIREQPAQMLDAKFLEELEKRLGKKESDDSSNKNLSSNSDISNLLLGIDGNPTSNIVPTLKPPPQTNKIKNTNVTSLPCKVQNTWSSKSVNLEQDNKICITSFDQATPSNLLIEDRLYDNMSRTNPNSQDTTTVFNRIWYERAMKDNVNVKNKQTNVNGYVDTGWSENIKQSPSKLYGSIQTVSSPIVTVKSEYGEFKCNQRNIPDSTNYNQEYNSFSKPTTSTYSNSSLDRPTSQLDLRQNLDVRQNFPLSQYGLPVAVLPENTNPQVNHHRHYNQVSDYVYSEVAEHIYNQPMKEVLRPHRPAPPSPMVLGYPQSLQQLQRKLGQIPPTTQV